MNYYKTEIINLVQNCDNSLARSDLYVCKKIIEMIP